jgi:fructosamine-3-kinase
VRDGTSLPWWLLHPTANVLRVPNPLLDAEVVAVVRSAISVHIGKPWGFYDFVDLTHRGTHRCGVFKGRDLSVFAKLSTDRSGWELFEAELRGLALLKSIAAAKTPTPVGRGTFRVAKTTSVLLFEAVAERHGHGRSSEDCHEMGRALGALHQTRGQYFGLEDFDGFYGPLPQDNRPTASGTWAEFYAERRLVPRLREAVDSGHLSSKLAAGVERVVERLPQLAGPDPQPALLHGDPQQNNIMSTDAGAVFIDPAPYFGHPEADLALVDIFEPLPDEFFDGYTEQMAIEEGFAERQELWRIQTYLAVVAVENKAFMRRYIERLDQAAARYR